MVSNPVPCHISMVTAWLAAHFLQEMSQMLKAAVPCKWLVAEDEKGVCSQPLVVPTLQVLSHGPHWRVCTAGLADEDLCPMLELICLGLLDTKGVPALVEIHTVSCWVDLVVKSFRGRCGEFNDPEYPKESEGKS